MESLPTVIGHRGAAALAPENTSIGIRRACREGAAWVEFDVKLTRDGVPILMHDDRLGRTTNGRGKVAETTLETIKALDAGSWFGPDFAGEPVPTLRTALKLAADLGLGVNVELKPCPGRAEETAKATLEMIDELWPDDRPQPLISSFDTTSLATVQALKPHVPRGYLCRRVPRAWRAAMERLGCTTLNVSDRWVRKAHIDAASAAGIPVLVYTVNDPLRARSLIEAGVSAVFTDRVDTLLAAFG